jgi:glycosyltransferase involved in cell wall biosynthesis
MNILIVNYSNFNTNSAIQIAFLANALVDIGVEVIVCVEKNIETAKNIENFKFGTITWKQAKKRNFGFSNGLGPSLVHAWTPRESVRQVVEAIVSETGCPYIVHLEDNEEKITSDTLGISFEQLKTVSQEQLNLLISPHLSHPLRYRHFLEQASGISVLLERLLDFKPLSLPSCVFWPAFNYEILSLTEETYLEARVSLGFKKEDFLVVYPGNVHNSNRDEVRSLYLAVSLLNQRGFNVYLLRFGTNYVPLFEEVFDFITPYCTEVGFRPHSEVISALGAADALVQPGTSNDFNDYRFPSKLPEFFASGRPVLLPKTNIGHHVKHQVNAILLKRGNALEIADSLELLIVNKEYRDRIGSAGKKFAIENFSWQRSASVLYHFYQEILSLPPKDFSNPINQLTILTKKDR